MTKKGETKQCWTLGCGQQVMPPKRLCDFCRTMTIDRRAEHFGFEPDTQRPVKDWEPEQVKLKHRPVNSSRLMRVSGDKFAQVVNRILNGEQIYSG